MIRTAISPRFATSTRSKGGLTGGRSSERSHGRGASASTPRSRLCAKTAPSERDVAMLLPRIRVVLVGKHLEGRDQTRAGVGRHDHIVDVTPGSRDVGIRELIFVFGNQ